MIVYLARDIPSFVLYCVNGASCSSLLVESTHSMTTDSMIRIASWPTVHVCEGSLQVGFQPFYIFLKEISISHW